MFSSRYKLNLFYYNLKCERFSGMWGDRFLRLWEGDRLLGNQKLKIFWSNLLKLGNQSKFSEE